MLFLLSILLFSDSLSFYLWPAGDVDNDNEVELYCFDTIGLKILKKKSLTLLFSIKRPSNFKGMYYGGLIVDKEKNISYFIVSYFLNISDNYCFWEVRSGKTNEVIFKSPPYSVKKLFAYTIESKPFFVYVDCLKENGETFCELWRFYPKNKEFKKIETLPKAVYFFNTDIFYRAKIFGSLYEKPFSIYYEKNRSVLKLK